MYRRLTAMQKEKERELTLKLEKTDGEAKEAADDE